jgi:indolepyruvate ferredoxin oxidoreductase alpha subunit
MKLNVVAMGDIGCYTLGGLPPYSSMQTSFCMGASVGNALGFSLAGGENGGPKPVGVIGDGTFLHGGIPALIDMVYTRSHATLIICDNSTTGMTGQQANPASGENLRGEEAPQVDLEKLIAALGVEHIRVVDPYDMKALRKTILEAVRHPAPAVVIARRPCLMRPEERAVKHEPIQFEQELCNHCKQCYDIGCPAIGWNDEDYPVIDELQCVGCELCAEPCKPGALHARGTEVKS